MMTIQQKEEWLKTRKPLTIVASESRFGYYVFRAYPYTPEEVAKDAEIYHVQKADANDAIHELWWNLKNEVEESEEQA